MNGTATMKEYRDLGIKLTPQRLAILACLHTSSRHVHPSAEEIYKVVVKQFPTMSLSTVYNTLEALREKGYLRELRSNDGKRRYDTNLDPHHHLICIRCRDIRDMSQNLDLPLSTDITKGFSVISVKVEFYGLCAKCRFHS